MSRVSQMRVTWTRWGTENPKTGDRCILGEARHGWLVRDVASGDEMTVLTLGTSNVRVHREGDPSVHSLSRDTEIEIVDATATRWFGAGSFVKILGPSKHAGKVGIVADRKQFYTVAIPDVGAFRIDGDFLAETKVEFKEIS